jgi:hypothetical protein
MRLSPGLSGSHLIVTAALVAAGLYVYHRYHGTGKKA